MYAIELDDDKKKELFVLRFELKEVCDLLDNVAESNIAINNASIEFIINKLDAVSNKLRNIIGVD